MAPASGAGQLQAPGPISSTGNIPVFVARRANHLSLIASVVVWILREHHLLHSGRLNDFNRIYKLLRYSIPGVMMAWIV